MIVDLTIDAARFIAHHLRWTWAREVAAGLPGRGTPQELDLWAENIIKTKNLPGLHACIAIDGKPTAMFGMIQYGHMATTWMAGTDRVNEVSAEIMKMVLRMHREMEKIGVRRFVSTCLDGPDELFSWLLRLGYSLEGRHPGMGIHGDAYLTFGKVIYHVR